MIWSQSASKTAISFLIGMMAMPILAQSGPDYKALYPGFNEVILSNNASYDISIEEKKIKIIQDNFYESIILNENGINNNQESFTHSDLIRLLEYDAYTVVNANGKEKKIKLLQSNERLSREGVVFHDDVKIRQLVFSNLEPGAKKVYRYKTQYLDHHLLHKFIFADQFPIMEAALEIKTDKDIELGFKVFNDPKNEINFTKTEKKGKWVYRWSMKQTKPYKSEPFSPGFLHVLPHIDVYIKEYTIDKVKYPGLESIDRLYDFYQTFVKDLNRKEDAELKKTAQEITAGAANDEEKVKSIFYWVKNNIKYIAFENGYEGFIPREAALVFERKFGDCKDMASIITAMANCVGIKNVYIAWIGTREIPYSYHELATPAVDNHMIAVFKKDGEYIFLDATDKTTHYGIPTSFIQGKEALIGEDGQYKIVKVPVVPALENQVSQTLQLSISNDKLIGKGSMTFNGYNRSDILDMIGDTTGKSRFERIKATVVKGSNKFNLLNYTEENAKDRDKPYTINFSFDLANFIVKVDKEIYVNLFLDRNFEKLVLEKDRETKFELDYMTDSRAVYDLEIPQGYKVKYLPKNLVVDNDLLLGEFLFEQKDNRIILKARIEEKKIVMDKNDFALWNETVRQIRNNYSETIILIEK